MPALADRLLMGPGPSMVYPEVTAALTHPITGHLDPAFLALMDEVSERLRVAFGTDNALTIALSGTGSAGMEAAIANVVAPGGSVVVGVNGAFGARMAEMCRRAGGRVTEVAAEWGTPLVPDDVLSAVASEHATTIAVVHAETSTGVRNDVAALGAAKGDALLVVDCVTSLGGVPVEVDGWGIDVAYSGSQKCLGAPPGLAPITASERARARLVPTCPSWYLDLRLIAEYAEPGSARRYHHTPPIAMLYGLHAALGVLLAEGLAAAYARHESCAAALVTGLEAMGLEPLVAPGHRLPQLTAVRVPESLPHGMGEADVRALLLDRHGVEIGGGLGPLAGRVWRIGCMGHGARLRNVETLLGCLAEVLER